MSSTIHLNLSALAEMKGLVNDVFGISGLYPARKLAKIGRCHYHSTIIQAIDDEILVKVNVGIGGKVDLR